MNVEDKPLVFIAHSSKDDEMAGNLSVDLQRAHIDCWVDEFKILPGDSLRQKIFKEGIPSCTCLLVLISSNSINSDWVSKEIDAAFVQNITRKNAKIVPYICASSEEEWKKLFDQLPSDIRSLHVGLLSEDNYDKKLSEIIATVYKTKIEQIELLRESEKQPMLKISFYSGKDEEKVIRKRFFYFEEEKGTPSSQLHLLIPGRDYRQEVEKYLDAVNWTVPIRTVLENAGTSSASNIRVEICIPKLLEFRKDTPTPPSRFSFLLPSFQTTQPWLLARFSQDPRIEEVIEFSEHTMVVITLNNLLHTVSKHLPTFFIVFPKSDVLESQTFELPYAVLSEETQRSHRKLKITLAWERDNINHVKVHESSLPNVDFSEDVVD